MSNNELWFWFWILLFGAITVISVFRSIKLIFYYRWEARRQMKLAEHGFDPRKKENSDV